MIDFGVCGGYAALMYLENVIVDTVDPQRLGRFWEAVVGGQRLTDEPDIVETRLAVEGGPVLDLCFPGVASAAASEPPRLHFELRGGADQAEEVERLLELGAQQLDVDQGEGARVVLADPEGNPCCVLEERAAHVDTGPIAALSLDSADPARDGQFWSWLSGWTEVPGHAPRTLQHPSRRGPLLELHPAAASTGASKNRMHLDIRLESGDDPDAVATGIVERGGRELHPDWGELPWRVYTDPSGNELCVLPARS
nr:MULTISPECIES: VOC family protein [unclassified Actinopolyspora]